MGPVLWGLGAGLALAVGMARVFGSARLRFVGSLLYEVSPFDATIFTLPPAVLVAVALVAIALPARRASRLEPRRALGG